MESGYLVFGGMAEKNGDEVKWEIQLRKEVKGITADQIWPIFEDFCSIHKVFPHLSNCWAVEGEYGKPGLIRYCVATTGFLPPSAAAVHQVDVELYAKEVLLTFDPVERCLSYQIIETNLGINDYVATVKVVPSHDEVNGGGCCIHWSVVADPMDGRTFEVFQSNWTSIFELKVQNIVALLSPATD